MFVIFVGRIGPIAYLPFYFFIKMWENLKKKPYQTQPTSVKTLKKHENVPMRTNKKRQVFFHGFLGK